MKYEIYMEFIYLWNLNLFQFFAAENLFKWFCCIPYDYNNKINEAYQKKIECFFLFLKENIRKTLSFFATLPT